MPTDEFKELKQRSLYSKLRRLFSTDVIVRNIGGKKLKVVDTDELAYATDRNTLRDRFNRIRTSAYNQYSRDFTLSYQAARIELFRDYDCVGPDTIIPLPDGSYPTISELTEKYKDKPQERFHVFSYDHATDSIKLGLAFHPRKKAGKRQGYKVTFDNGQYVVGSLKHPFMMRDGSYKRIFELRVGDSVMPFYQHEYGYKKNGIKPYRRVYNFSEGYQSIHKMVVEQFQRKLNGDEVIHHRDFNGFNNSPENLQIMDRKKHDEFHANHSKNVLWGDENYENQLKKLKSHPNYISRKFHHWNGERIGENNPFYGKEHSNESNEKRSETLKSVFVNRDQTGEKNPKYRGDVTFDNVKEKAYEYYKEYSKINLWDFIKHIKCDHSTLQNRLKKEKHDWKSFKQEVETTLNHKIVSIEMIGETDVYDVTVEEYHNFATDSCFVKNTMDMDPIISSALDIYADECLTQNELGDMLTIRSTNDNVKQILHNLFYDILNIEFNLWSWTRNLVKYGDFYLKMYVSPEFGVYMVEPMSSYNVTRVENSDLNNKNYIKFQANLPEGGKIEELENYQVAHFRLLSDSNFLPYGKGIIEGARRVWKQVSLMEDAMLIHRIMRAPEKRIYKVDIGNIPPNEVDQYMEKLITKTKKVPYIDEKTGDYNLRFNLWNMVEDIYLPVRGNDSGTSIEPLSGMEFTGIDDIEYLRNKMMAALKIPKAFLGYEEDLSGKATLAAEDVRFARTIQRVQKFIVSELTKIAIVHLYSQGYRDAELVDFSLELTNPSTIFEKEKVSVWQEKTNLAKDMIDAKIYSRKWIHTTVFNTSDDDIDVINNDIIEDAKSAFRLKKIEEEGIDPAKPYNKINAGEEGAGATPEPGAEPEAAPTETPAETPAAGAAEAPPLKERDQTGRKKASNYPFGEDPLGSGENKRRSNKTTTKYPISHAYKNNSPLSFEGLDLHLRADSKKSILIENLESNKKSFLDESNIIE
jgi:hypothetical protein